MPLPGRLEVITGPMFSGKSEELIRRLRRARIARQRLLCFKPDIDLRYHPTSISSHSAQSLNAIAIPTVDHLRSELFPVLDSVDVIGIDEAQFFSEDLVPLAVDLVRFGKRVLLAGLDTTFAAEPFDPMPHLMALADEVLKLSAVCTVCGQPAIHTQRIDGGSERIVVGAAATYEARCRAHFSPVALSTHPPEQLELTASVSVSPTAPPETTPGPYPPHRTRKRRSTP